VPGEFKADDSASPWHRSQKAGDNPTCIHTPGREKAIQHAIDVMDTHTAVLMREHGIARICTRDTDFNQFPFLEVIDPLRP